MIPWFTGNVDFISEKAGQSLFLIRKSHGVLERLDISLGESVLTFNTSVWIRLTAICVSIIIYAYAGHVERRRTQHSPSPQLH